MKTKYFLNLTTGEVVRAKHRLHAYKIFKADGKRLNYKTPFNKVVFYMAVTMGKRAYEELADGNQQAVEYDA